MNEQELYESLKVTSSLAEIHGTFKDYLILMLLSTMFSSVNSLLRIRHWVSW